MSTPHNTGSTRRLNILDIILIFIIVGAVAFACVTVIKSNPNIISGGDKEIKYVVVSKELSSAIATQIKVGDKVYDDISNQLLGIVTDIKVSESYLTGFSPIFGLPVNTPIEGKVDISITVKASVWVDGSSYKIDKYRIAVGQVVDYHSDSISLSGQCTSISNVE